MPGFELGTGVIVGAALGIVVVSTLWWLYFDVAAIFALRRLVQAKGLELARLALHAYSYLHLPMIVGIVLFALGLKTTLGHPGEALDTVPAVALCGGAALYLLGHVAFLYRTTGRVFRRRTVGAVVLLALLPLAVAIPALAALALVSAVCSFIVAYEATPLSRAPGPGPAPRARRTDVARSRRVRRRRCGARRSSSDSTPARPSARSCRRGAHGCTCRRRRRSRHG